MLSRAVLDLNRREYLDATEALAQQLAGTPERDLVQTSTWPVGRTVLSRSRCSGSTGASSARAQIVRRRPSLSGRPKKRCCRFGRAGRSSVSSPCRAAVTSFVPRRCLPRTHQRTSRGYCLPCFQCPSAVGALADTVQRAHTQYGELSYLREPSKYSFRLTLTLVLLLSLLAAVYGAFFSAQRLVKPIQDLAAGTRAVGKGDFDTRLPLSSRDEMGFLVHSFNDMTKRLARAREEAASQPAGRRERTREPGGHPRTLVDGCCVSRGRHEDSSSEPGCEQHSRGPISRRRPARHCRLSGSDNLLTQFMAALQRRLRSGRRPTGANSWNYVVRVAGAF